MSYTMRIDGIDAIVTYDQDIGKFRGEFCGLSGGVDFYADDLLSLE